MSINGRTTDRAVVSDGGKPSVDGCSYIRNRADYPEGEIVDEDRIGPFRWRGSWNWKDITERSMAGFMGAGIFYLLVRVFGG